MKRSVILLIALVWMYSACEKPTVPNEVEEPDLPCAPFELTKSQEEFVEDNNEFASIF